MADFIYFTEEQKEQVRETDLVAYLKRYHYKLKRSSSEYEWDSPQGKVTIRDNRWYHQYEQEGGYIISFFERFFNLTFQETMLMLLEEQGIRYEPAEGEKNSEKKTFELPKASDNMRRIYAYFLKERHLDREVIQHFIHNKLIYEDAEYHNVVFVAPLVLLHILKTNPKIDEVHPCLEHDKAGIEGDYRIAEAVRELGEYRIKPELPRHKDWNEGVKALQGITAIPATEHPGLVKMKKLCPELVKGCEGVKVKKLLDHLQTRFEKLNNIALSQDEKLAEQSYGTSIGSIAAMNHFINIFDDNVTGM